MKNKLINKIREKINEVEIQFDIKKVRTFKDFGKYFGNEFDPILTDYATFAFHNPNENRLFYETNEYTDYVDRKLGDDENFRKFTIKDYKWKVLKTGFLGYKNDMMFYLNLHVDLGKTKVDNHEGEREIEEITIQTNYSETIPMSCILGEGDLRIDKVYGCIDPSKVVFNLRSTVEESIYMVWSLETNNEVSNFSAKNTCYFTNGSGSQTGYIFWEDNFYVNLEVGIPNYFFDSQFTLENVNSSNGFKINKDESFMLYQGMNANLFFKSHLIHIGAIYSKMNFADIDLLERLLQDPDQINEASITNQYGGFQIKGNSIFHMYSLNADKLSLLIEYFTENNPQALKSLLIRNFEGKTPLDISMSQDSTKTTDLMLKAIANFDEGSYSGQIYKEFPKLIIKGLNSFLDYLDTCTFQTVQMKNMKYLALRNTDEK